MRKIFVTLFLLPLAVFFHVIRNCLEGAAGCAQAAGQWVGFIGFLAMGKDATFNIDRLNRGRGTFYG